MWSDEKLAQIPIDNGFRQRGLDMTRLETFTDAAFAFALTLLVISFDNVPTNIAELKLALKNIPAFAVSFSLISMFWYAHHKWSRRYGLDDMVTVIITLTFVFAVYGCGFTSMSAMLCLLYRHALKTAHLNLNTEERFTTEAEMQAWMIIGSAGVVSTLIALLAPPPFSMGAGWVYALLGIVMPFFGYLKSRQ